MHCEDKSCMLYQLLKGIFGLQQGLAALLLWGIGEQSRSCESHQIWPLIAHYMFIFPEVTSSRIKYK
jgi:hypothetical protein